MSQENVELVQNIIESTRRGDFAAALGGYDDAVVLDQSRMPDGGVFHGRDGVLAFYTGWFGACRERQGGPAGRIPKRRRGARDPGASGLVT